MSIATSAIERLQDVAGRTGAVTRADERAAAAELQVPLAAVHGAASFYDDLAKTRRGSRHVRVCEGTACFAADAASTLLMLNGHSASQLVPAARTGWYRCRRCAALATAMQRPRC